MSQLGGGMWLGAKLAATMLLTNPGVPFMYYGEEIGMQGAKPDERIRTPMQWDASATAGFTTAEPWEPLAEVRDGASVAEQNDDPDSLLSQYRNLIRLRLDHPALRVGEFVAVKSDPSSVYAYLRHSEEETLMVLLNLGQESDSSYSLNLAQGPLTGLNLSPTMLLGDGDPVAPVVNGTGGFDSYQPLAELAPRTGYVISLASAPGAQP